jgi:hypothetical protein
MRTLAIPFTVSLFVAASSSGQAPLSLPAEANPTHIQAQLDTPIRLAKAKVGEKLKALVVAQAALKDGTAIPAMATLMGQVTKTDAESVTLAFDKVDVDGKKIPLNITLVAAAQLGAPGSQTTDGGKSKMVSPSGGSLPNDHALNGGGYSVLEAGNNAAKGVGHESLSEVNSVGGNSNYKRGTDVHTTAGSVIGLPGVTLAVDDGPPYGSRFQFGNKEKQLPKGIQLMFTAR